MELAGNLDQDQSRISQQSSSKHVLSVLSDPYLEQAFHAYLVGGSRPRGPHQPIAEAGLESLLSDIEYFKSSVVRAPH
jgi:hypothetical protein